MEGRKQLYLNWVGVWVEASLRGWGARGEVKTEQQKERKKERGSDRVPERCGERREEAEGGRREAGRDMLRDRHGDQSYASQTLRARPPNTEGGLGLLSINLFN